LKNSKTAPRKTSVRTPAKLPLPAVQQPSVQVLDPGLEKLFDEVSRRVSPLPHEAETEKAFALKLVGILEKALSGEGVKVFFVGSTARDTGLRGDRDIDLFVSYPIEKTREHIVESTVSAVKASIPGSWEMHYAEHPYLQARLGTYSVEVIPCFQIAPNQPIKSAVDRSPLHMDYLQKRLSDSQKRDVRVLKQLFKNAKIYGAEARVGGFSGLVCEYLMLNFRSLQGLLGAAAGWKPPVAIDLEGQIAVAGTEGVAQIAEKFGAPFVLVDAIDRRRNAAASVSMQNLCAFISLSKAFLQKPSLDFFFCNTTGGSSPSVSDASKKVADSVRSRGSFVCVLEFPAPDEVEDILFPQLRRTLTSISALLVREGFSVLDNTDFVSQGKAFFVFDFAVRTRSAVRAFDGPPAWSHEDVRKFAAAHKNALRGPFLRGERVMVEERQLPVAADDFLEQLVKSNGAGASIGSKFERHFRRAKVVAGKGLLDLPQGAVVELAGFLRKKEFWL